MINIQIIPLTRKFHQQFEDSIDEQQMFDLNEFSHEVNEDDKQENSVDDQVS